MLPRTLKPPPDLDPREWIRAVIDGLKVSQGEFGVMIVGPATERGETRRDTVTKWIAKRNPREPGFTYTRRIVTVAPPALVSQFVGRATDQMSDLARTVPVHIDDGIGTGGFKVTTPQSAIVGRMLDAISDEAERNAAMDRAREAILHPHRLGAGKRPDRTQRR